jgi:hypothetical protein
MTYLRIFVREHRKLAGLIVGFALLMKALIPAGYMLGAEGRVLTVEICTGVAGEHLTQQIVLPTDGKPHDRAGSHDKVGTICPFASLAMGTVGAADAALLQAALLFIVLLGFLRVPAIQRGRIAYLRPPSRGPPSSI